MSKYFDRDFFRFFLRFAAILSISLIMIIAARLYQSRTENTASTESASVVNAINR